MAGGGRQQPENGGRDCLRGKCAFPASHHESVLKPRAMPGEYGFIVGYRFPREILRVWVIFVRVRASAPTLT